MLLCRLSLLGLLLLLHRRGLIISIPLGADEAVYRLVRTRSLTLKFRDGRRLVLAWAALLIIIAALTSGHVHELNLEGLLCLLALVALQLLRLLLGHWGAARGNRGIIRGHRCISGHR